MIITVTLNPAIDVTYRLPRLTVGEVHRVAEVTSRLGGKGVNLTRVLHQLGEPTHAVGLADEGFAEALARELPSTFLPELGEVRRTVVVAATDSTTSLWEPGRPAAPGADRRLLDLIADRIADATALTVSGSLAPGVPADLPARIARLAATAGVPVLLDLDDAALAAAVGTGAVLTPNEDEAARLLGHTLDDPVAAVAELAARHGGPVVLTRGHHGMLACADGGWQVRPPTGVVGNPTGAGDAAAAGLARGLAGGGPWPHTLRDAAALGAAAVVAPVAGEIDPDAYATFLTEVRVDRIDGEED